MHSDVVISILFSVLKSLLLWVAVLIIPKPSYIRQGTHVVIIASSGKRHARNQRGHTPRNHCKLGLCASRRDAAAFAPALHPRLFRPAQNQPHGTSRENRSGCLLSSRGLTPLVDFEWWSSPHNAPPASRFSSTTGIRRLYTLHPSPATPPKKHQRRYLSIPPQQQKRNTCTWIFSCVYFTKRRQLHPRGLVPHRGRDAGRQPRHNLHLARPGASITAASCP